MNNFWDENVPFIPLLGIHHLIYIGLVVILLFLLISRYKEVKINSDIIRKWILALLIGQQILLYSWYIFEMGFDVSESLPLHISRISSLLGVVYLMTKNDKVLNVLFYFGLFAYGSFFYPQRVYPFYHALGISFFLNHAITILLPIFAAVAYEWRPQLKGAFKAYGWFIGYFVFVYFLNPLIDGNYFYLKYRPFFGYLSDSNYITIVIIATLGIFLLGYYLSKLVQSIVEVRVKLTTKKM